MAHSCPDGTHTKLVRTGPVGTLEGVTFTCPRCGFSISAEEDKAQFEAFRAKLTAKLVGTR